MKPIFKPKNLKVYVPGHGVIEKADFTDVHLKACVRQVEAAGIDVEEYLKKHMEVSGFSDLPLFTDESKKPEPKGGRGGRKNAVEPEPVAGNDDEELNRLIAEEAAADKKEQGEAKA